MIGTRTANHPEWKVMCFRCLSITKIKDLLFIRYKSAPGIFSEACPECHGRVWYAVWDENGVKR